MAALVADLIARAERRRADRATFDSHFEEIRELFYPFAASFVGTQTAGQKVHDKVFDSTGEQAVDLLVAGLLARLTSPVERWFSIRAMEETLNEDDDVNAWTEAVTDRLYAVFNSPSSNFASQQHEKYLDLSTFGSGCMYIYEKPGIATTMFATRPLAECYFGEDSEGRVDSVDRWFKLTARQAVQKWQGRAGSKVAAAAADPKKQDDLFEFLHAVYPRADRDAAKADTRNMPVAECYINVSEKSEIVQSGFEEFPYSCPRWSKRAGEVYGRGAGVKTLADNKMLQRVMKVTIRGTEKIVDPPLLVADDGVVGPVRLTPAGLSYARAETMQGAGAPVRPLLTGGRPDLGEEFMAGIRKRIESGFYTPLLQFARDPKMTATQVLQIDEQTQMSLAPLLGRLQAEDLNPMIQRVYGIELRAGRLPEPPMQLQGQPLKVEYVSPLARLQKISRAKALAQTMELIAPLAQANPEILDNFDLDKASRETGVLLGMAIDWLRPLKDVEAMRKARQQVQEQQAQLQQAAMLAEGAGKAAPALKLAIDNTQGAAA